MSSRRGIFGALLFAAILAMPFSIFNANAQEYIDYDKYNDKNKDYYFYPPKDKKQDPMLVVIKELFICDSLINEGEGFCEGEPFFPAPDSDRYLECTDNVCDPIGPESFEITIEDKLVFEGSEEGKKINFNGERYTVTEQSSSEENEFNGEIDFFCKTSEFDQGIVKELNVLNEVIDIGVCVLFEGECSGILQKGELNECTVKNYITASEPEFD